jgi:outer membrane usher protein
MRRPGRAAQLPSEALLGARAPVMMKRYCVASFLMASLALASAGYAAPATGVAPPDAAEEQPVMRLNPSNRDYEIEVPLKLDGVRLGDVRIKITPQDKIFVDAKTLRTYLGKTVREEVLTAALAPPEGGGTAQVAGGVSVVGKKASGDASSSVMQLATQHIPAPEPGPLGDEPPSYLPLEVLGERGIRLRYDSQATELLIEPTVDQRRPGDISFVREGELESASMEQPAYVSAYLNIRAAASYVSQTSYGSTGVESPSFYLDGAARIGSFVLEGEGSFYTGDAKGFASCYFQDYVLYRRGTRLVYDLPEEAIRFRFGDLAPDYAGLQSSPDVLGVSATKTYATLQPGRSIRPTGARSFRIERPSTVEVFVGAAMIRRLKLGPGVYNISDLPLQSGANDIKLVIEDDTGARQTLDFTAFSGQELLSPGLSEWSASAGVKSLDRGIIGASAPAGGYFPSGTRSKGHSFYGQRDYYFDQPVVTGYYREGLTPALTASFDLQADDRVVMAGAGLVTQTRAGLFTGQLAASDWYSDGPGYAVRLGYGYDKFDWFGEYKAAFRMLAEWRSNSFSTVRTYTDGLAYMTPNYNASLSASYTQRLPYDITAGLSASYYLLLDDPAYRVQEGARWDTDFTVSRQLWDNVSGSLSIGYGRDDTSHYQTYYNQDGFRTYVRLAWTPDANSRAMASYDSRSESGRVSYTQNSETKGIGAWTATAEAASERNDQGGVNASASYTANRAEVTASHTAGLTGLAYNGSFNPYFTEERTSVGVATSFVYADGAWGMGRPVRGGFALVTPHKSLDGSPIAVGSADQIMAQSDFLGPAVVTDVGAYRQTRVPYDAPGAPAGYDLGSATFDLKPPYKAGYNLQAGSAYTVTAMGTLLDAQGEPLPLLAGTAREAGKENGRKVELFTNRAGRFGAQGLAAGRWIIEMPTEPEATRYVIDIPEGVIGLHKAGELKPSGAGPQQKPPVLEARASHEPA